MAKKIIVGLLVLLVLVTVGYLIYRGVAPGKSEEDVLKVSIIETQKLIVGQEEVKQQNVQTQNVETQNVQTQNVQTQNVEKQKVQEQCVEKQCTQTSCQNECFPNGQRRCAPGCLTGNQYQICGNYDSDSCLEWSSILICPADQICQNGQCVARCTLNYSKTCYDNKIYWYDSCGNRKEQVQNCGISDWTDEYQCIGNWVQRKWINRSCLASQCFATSEWKNYQDCGIFGQVCQTGKCVLTAPKNPPPPVTPPSSSCPTCRPGPEPY